MDDRLLLIRPADLATLRFVLDNMVLDGARLRRVAAGEPAGFTLVLPPQHFRENVTVPFAAPPQLAAANESSLEFRLADDTDSVEVAGGGLLALCERLLIGQVIALPAGAELVPLDGRWRWGSEPELLSGRGALWRAKLDGPRPDGTPRARFQLVRAAEPVHAEWDILPSMAQLRERQSGVMEASRFDFSPIGASVRMQGPVDFGSNPMTPERQKLVGSYQHDMDFGRDSRVQVVGRGHLSSGHPASLIQLRRRVFTRNPDAEFGEHEAVADLQTLTTIVVADPVLVVAQLASAYGGPARDMPFRTLRLLTTYLTELDPIPDGGLTPFWVEARGLPVRFALQGTDWAGNVVDFAMPLIFIPGGQPFDKDAFAAKGGLERCTASVGSRSIALVAPESAAAREAAPLTVDSIVLGVQNAAPGHTGSPVLPVLPSLRVVVDAVTHFTGLRTPVEATWHQEYRSSGLDGTVNRLGTYLTLPSRLQVNFGDPRRVGGLARPDMEVAALSVVKGALPAGFDTAGAPDVNLIKEQFNTAKVLGIIALTDVVDFDTLGPPELTEKITAEQAELRYSFVAAIKDKDKGNTSALQPAGGSSLRLTATVVRRFADGATSTTMSGFLTNVAITVADVAILGFTSLNFRADPGTTPTIDPQGPSLRFAGDLDFLQPLSEALEDLGLGGAVVRVGTDRITAGFAATLPALKMGMFSLTNLAIVAQLTLPFNGDPVSFTFAVGERFKPFSVMVSLFTGGGFLALTLTSNGVERLEVALEFGGSMQLDIVVASGGLSVMAGIYVRLEGERATLGGYVRASGQVTVLGIVTLSADFFLQLSYQTETKKAIGEASLTLGIKVLFFSKSVTLRVERRFSALTGDPTFLECYEVQDWEAYCDAFA